MEDKQLNDRILDLMFSISRLMKDEMKFSSPAASLSMLQIQALLFIDKQKEVQMKDLAANFTITLPTATSLVDNLMRSKLVLRKKHADDRRVVGIQLSSQGKKLLAKAMQKRSQKINMMLSYLPHKERKDLLKILSSLKKSLEKENEA